MANKLSKTDFTYDLLEEDREIHRDGGYLTKVIIQRAVVYKL